MKKNCAHFEKLCAATFNKRQNSTMGTKYTDAWQRVEKLYIQFKNNLKQIKLAKRYWNVISFGRLS